jgi:hypothetical protein
VRLAGEAQRTFVAANEGAGATWAAAKPADDWHSFCHWRSSVTGCQGRALVNKHGLQPRLLFNFLLDDFQLDGQLYIVAHQG